MRQDAARLGSEFLHRRLSEFDPASAARIHPNNLPRVIRALEIVERLGAPVPGLTPDSSLPALYLGVSMPRERLHEVADARVRSQVAAGLVEETRLLLAMGYDRRFPSMDGFGYRQMTDYLEGTSTLEQAIREYQAATRRYIRRQMTWFRQDTRIRWLEARPDILRLARDHLRGWLATVS